MRHVWQREEQRPQEEIPRAMEEERPAHNNVNEMVRDGTQVIDHTGEEQPRNFQEILRERALQFRESKHSSGRDQNLR